MKIFVESKNNEYDYPVNMAIVENFVITRDDKKDFKETKIRFYIANGYSQYFNFKNEKECKEAYNKLRKTFMREL